MTARQMGLASWLLVLGLGVPVQAETFIVTTTADSGTGSLREQITAANVTAEKDVIAFDVAGTIRLVSPLPQITQPLEMDGEGAIEIDGTDLDAGVFALDIQHASECVIEGMTIRGFDGEGSGAIRIQGNAFDNLVANNILAGNLFGVVIAEGPAEPGRNRIEANYIDAEVGALAPVPGVRREIDGANAFGILLLAASGNVISENWLFRAYNGISIIGDNPRVGYVGGEANGNEVTRNRTFFTSSKGLIVALDASDNTLSANEVYYAGRHGVELFGDAQSFGNLGRVANRNVVVDNLFVGTGFNDPDTSSGILVIGSTHDDIVVRNRISSSSSHGITVWEAASGNVFQENEVDGADGYGIRLVGARIPQHLPGTGPVAENRFERNVISNTGSAVSIQGDVIGNLFRENIFGSQRESVVVRVDGNRTPEAPDRVAADNRFEKNLYSEVKGLVRWVFTNSTRNNTICDPDLPGRLELAAQLRSSPDAVGNVVVPHCDDKD